MGGPPPLLNLKPTYYTLLQLLISWPLTLCFTYSPFALQTLGIPNHVVWATNSGCTKPRARILATGAVHIRNHVPTLDQLTVTSFPQKDTVMPYIAQPRYPLNSQVLAIFFPSATITATPHHLALLIDILHSMVGYRFDCIS